MLRSIIPIVRSCTSVSIRTYLRDGNRKPRDRAGVRIQQGILNNLDALEEDPEVSYDADFSQLHVSHAKHEKEMALQKEQLKYYTIRSKYFKSEKMPNFLTWAEKEQIRYLNKTEPKDWTPERLAESFPAVEDVIIKVLKAKWTPTNMKRIQKHDENVKRNWELFKANEIKDLDPEVREHLQKFSKRNFDNIQNAYVQTDIDQNTFQFPKPKSKEFLHIISSCKRIDANTEKESIGAKPTSDQIEGKKQVLLGDETNIEPVLKIPRYMQKRVVTFDELKEKAKEDSSKSQDDDMHLSVSLLKQTESNLLSDVDKTPTNADNRVIETPTNVATEIDTYADESKNDGVVNLTLADISSSKMITKYTSKQPSSLATTNTDSALLFRPKIKIPKRLQKHGSVYKLYDCFYDDRGEFLYRVPGLRD